MKYIFSFDSVNDNELLLSGGKAASLVKLTKNGLNFPEGYIITASALENNLLNKEAAAELNELITMLSGRYTYAVRSSALNEDGAAASFSHAAIVAREFGIPAVVGCGNASSLLRTGDTVRVNGALGTVEIID